jgi:hypothetical protein
MGGMGGWAGGASALAVRRCKWALGSDTLPLLPVSAAWLYCLYCRTCPLEYMEDLGFGELVLVGSFAVSMSGGW